MGSVAIVALALTSVISCATAPTGLVVALPNSYYLTPDKDGLQTQLVRRDGGHLLQGHVAAYAVSGQIVAGAVGDVQRGRLYTNEEPFKGGPDTRYFILDTGTGKLEFPLEEAAWRKRLQELGVQSDFKIYPLLPWQQ